jgi:hypothetical protein
MANGDQPLYKFGAAGEGRVKEKFGKLSYRVVGLLNTKYFATP